MHRPFGIVKPCVCVCFDYLCAFETDITKEKDFLNLRIPSFAASSLMHFSEMFSESIVMGISDCPVFCVILISDIVTVR